MTGQNQLYIKVLYISYRKILTGKNNLHPSTSEHKETTRNKILHTNKIIENFGTRSTTRFDF